MAHSAALAAAAAAAAAPAGAGSFRELQSAADIAALADAQSRVSLLGFGSLLSERSARSTFSELQGFSFGRVQGFRRVFCHAAPIFFERGIARPETREISSLSVEPSQEHSIVVSFFTIPAAEVPLFVEREHEFRFLEVPSTAFASTGTAAAPAPPGPQGPSVICSRYSDKEYRAVRLQGDAEEYERRYGRWGIGTIWDDALLPCRVYLRHCVLAARNLGPEAYNSFLDETFLADRVTTIRQYLEAEPSIMKEMPPVSLADRYGG